MAPSTEVPIEPSFFVAGAPKCGTTALVSALAQHPEVFMPSIKEPHHFGSDLTPRLFTGNREAYLKLFGDAGDRRCGEGSTFYLFSKTAAEEIADFNPEANVVVMLRNPITVIESLHNQLLFDGTEDLTNIDLALEAEPDRRQGQRVPKHCRRPEALRYTDVVRFGEQVTRFLDVFGPERLELILHDDFVADRAATFGQIFKMIGVDPSFEPEFELVNERKAVRSRIIATTVIRLQTSALAKTMLRKVSTPELRDRLAHRIKVINGRPVAGDRLSSASRQQIIDHLGDDVELLASLLGRDLSHWLEPVVSNEEVDR